MRAKKYESIKLLLENGRITEFEQLFDYVPKTWLREHLHTSNDRITLLMTNVSGLTVQEIFNLSLLFKVDHTKIAQVVFAQYVKTNKKKKK